MTGLNRKRLRIPEWPVLLIGLCVMLIISAPFFTWWQMNRNPLVHVPMPVMPVPNAFDYYVNAASLVPTGVDPNLSALTPVQRMNLLALRDSVRNNPAMRRRMLGLYQGEPPKTYGGILRGGLTKREGKQASQMGGLFLSESLSPEVVSVIVQGEQYPCHVYPIRSYDTRMPYLTKYRNMERYFGLLSQMSSEQGDWTGAMDDCLMTIRFGSDTIHGSSLLGALVGEACEAIARKQADTIINHLSPLEARRAMSEMEEINAREVSFSQTMVEEKWFDEAALLEIFRSPNWRERFVQEHFGDEKPFTKSNVHYRLLFVNKRRSLALLTEYFNTCIAMTQGSFSLRKSDDKLMPNDFICRSSVPICEKGWVKSLGDLTGNHMLTIQLALRAYQGEQGTYPTTLAALVSAGYLTKLPDDPFAPSGSFRYARKGSGYLLYSIGPDGIDDGGKPIMISTDPSRSDPVHVDTKGDIVAGVNRI